MKMLLKMNGTSVCVAESPTFDRITHLSPYVREMRLHNPYGTRSTVFPFIPEVA